MTVAQILIALAGVLLVISACLALIRLAKGPSGLDRAVAADVILAILIAAIAAHAVWYHTGVALGIILVLSLVGFIGAVGMARLITGARLRERRFRDVGSDGVPIDTGAPSGAWFAGPPGAPRPERGDQS